MKNSVRTFDLLRAQAAIGTQVFKVANRFIMLDPPVPMVCETLT
jgi:hypothetical protein